MIRFLFRNLKGHRFLIVIAIGLTFAQVGVALLAPFPLKFILDKIVNHHDPIVPLLGGLLNYFDHFGTRTDLHPGEIHTKLGVILLSCSMLIAIGILTAILTFIQLYLASFIGQNLTARLRKQLFGHLERLSLEWHGKQKKGDLVQRVTGNIADIEKLVTDGLIDLLSGVLVIAGVIVVMILTNWQFTVLSIVIVPALFVVVLGYTTGIKAASKKASKAAGQVANVATEDVGAITVLKAFTLEEREAIRFKRYVDKNRKAGLRAGGLQAQFTPLVAILVAIGTAIIVGVGAYVAGGQPFKFWFFDIEPGPALNPTFTFGTLTVFLAYLSQFFQPMRDLSKLTNLATSASAGAERIQEVLNAAPEVLESGTPYYGPTRLNGDIAFENVIFGYTPTHPILKGINLKIPAGRKVALVGLSGGGKTTLVKLIARFYEIQTGSVRIDGADSRMYPLSVLRQNVSMVLQDNVLFEGTIRENIEIGKPGATMEEVIEAAKKAHIHDTIMDMPDGYNTEVREQGKNFSGGQRQRLAIARAILRDAPILILDEPTAALDVEAEAEVMHALDKLVVGRTVLMISHRLSTLGNVDEIIVLKDGLIVEQGTFKELKRRGGVFAGLLEEQNRYNLDREGDKSIVRSAFVPRVQVYEQRNVPPLSSQKPAAAPRPVVPQAGSLGAFFRPPVPPPVPAPTPIARVKGGSPAQGKGYDDGRQPPVPVKRNIPQQGTPYQKARVLIELDGKIIGEQQLNKPLLTVGRLTGNDVRVPSQRVSRLHAKIRWENGAWLIEDAESVNGLVYQGHQVERLVLTNGDRVYLTPTAVIRFESRI